MPFQVGTHMTLPLKHKRSNSYDRNWISVEQRRSIYKRDNNKCVYCDSRYMLQLDHVKPRAKGGTDDPRNLVTSCRTCNLAKGARTIPGRTVQAKVSYYRKERLRVLGKTKRGSKRRNRASSVSMSRREVVRWDQPWMLYGAFLFLIYFSIFQT
jgi:hypothetical protein